MALLTSAALSFFVFLQIYEANASGCAPRVYPGKNSPVCVCNCTYCDKVEPIGTIDSDTVVVYTTSQSGKRLERTTTKKKSVNLLGTVLSTLQGLCVNLTSTFQEITGFGGTITDEAALNILSLRYSCPNIDLTDVLMKSYYSNDGGLEYNLGRVPIASNDGSTHVYTYDDTITEDFDLTQFALAPEDINLKIPVLQRALQINNQLKLLAASWTAPAWMKNCNCTTGGDFPNGRMLKGDPGGPYYKTWANYIVKFLQAYKANNVSFWSLSPQNEPVSSNIVNWQSQTYFPWTERDFIKKDLGPALRSNGFDTKLFIYDDSRYPFLKKVCSDNETLQYIQGVALHWYNDVFVAPQILDTVHLTFPNLQLLNTESYWYRYTTVYTLSASSASLFFVKRLPTHLSDEIQNDTNIPGVLPAPSPSPSYGDWQMAPDLAKSIIQNLNHWLTGWMDWCMAVDTAGGPQWAPGPLDAAVIVNASGGEFYKQPHYYAMGHFSKFLPPGSKRIGLTLQNLLSIDLPAVAFLRPDGYKVIIAVNDHTNDLVTTIIIELGLLTGQSIPLTIPGGSIVTVVYK